MTRIFARFMTNKSGATAIEYGLIAALVSVVIITAVTAMGTDLTAIFEEISVALGGGTTA